MPPEVSAGATSRRVLPEKGGTAVTVLLCFLVAIVEGFDIQAIGVAAPRLAPELGLDSGALGLIFSFGNVGFVIGAMAGGWLADRIGRKPVFVGAVLFFGLFTLATTVTTTFWPLLSVRFLAGMNFGAALPIMMAMAAEVTTGERRALTASMMFCGMPFGGGLSALLTQAFPPDFDWRWLFYIGGAIPVALVPVLWFLLPETLRSGEKRESPRVSTWHALFGGGRATATLLLWATFLPTLIILYLILNWLPTLVAAIGIDTAIAPQASLAFNFASIAGALLLGKLVDRFDARWPLTLAYAGLVISLIVLSQSEGILPILIFSGAAGFFLLGANYALYGVAPVFYDREIRGTGAGASIAVGRVGAIAGPALAGVLLSSGLSASGVVGYMIPVAAVAGIAVFALSFCRRGPE
jgi:AAHS family 3-hydroxyphenylpropionic acid transporter